MTRLGKHHPLVRRIRTLRRQGAERRAAGLLLAEGVRLAEVALSSGADVSCALVSSRLEATRNGAHLRRRLEGARIPVYELSDRDLDSLEDARSPEPVLLLVRFRFLAPGELLDRIEPRPLVVVACGVQDPGNLGSLLRTADACGASGFVATEGGVELDHPRAVRATAGSIFRLPAARAEAGWLVEELRRRGYRQVAADPRGRIVYDGADWSGRLAIWLGSEGSGLPLEILEAVDETVRIPMEPGVESLSVGAAAAVVLYEARRARTGRAPRPTSG